MKVLPGRETVEVDVTDDTLVMVAAARVSTTTEVEVA